MPVLIKIDMFYLSMCLLCITQIYKKENLLVHNKMWILNIYKYCYPDFSIVTYEKIPA